MITKAVRIGLLVAMIAMSIYSIYAILFITIHLYTSSIFAPILILVLGVLMFFVLREIRRIIMWKGY